MAFLEKQQSSLADRLRGALQACIELNDGAFPNRGSDSSQAQLHRERESALTCLYEQQLKMLVEIPVRRGRSVLNTSSEHEVVAATLWPTFFAQFGLEELPSEMQGMLSLTTELLAIFCTLVIASQFTTLKTISRNPEASREEQLVQRVFNWIEGKSSGNRGGENGKTSLERFGKRPKE